MRPQFVSLIAIALVSAACSEQPKRDTRQTIAVVVNIAPGFSPRWDTDKVQVTAKSPDGLVAVKTILTAKLKCRVGDMVKASAHGMVLTLDVRACIA